jgi:hypothetical protein
VIAALLLTVFTFTAPFHPVQMVNGRPDPFGRADTTRYLSNPMTVEFHFDERQHTYTPIWGIWNVECQPRIVQTLTNVFPGDRVVYDDGWKCSFGTMWVETISAGGGRSARSNYVPSRLVYGP